ncbi:YesL family protein [Bacillus cihuensis]|uniref:YesL family protein n=1 Tax=Bacillus cihuensis TaxID=1208599 RepID=UPI00041CDF59|nr:YesL family protein [Bacillus cihuensis]
MGRMLQEVSEWIVRLVWTNILWFVFIVAGLGVFGIMPATVALFAVTRKWKMKELDVSILKIFKETFKKEFVRSNCIGLIYAAIGFFLYVDLRIAENMEGTFSVILYVFISFIILLYLNTIVHFFPVYVHYHYSIREYIKQSFIISLISPFSTILIGIGLFFIGYLITNILGLLPFISGVLPAYWIMNVCINRFNTLERQQSQVNKQMKFKESVN